MKRMGKKNLGSTKNLGKEIGVNKLQPKNLRAKTFVVQTLEPVNCPSVDWSLNCPFVN